MQIKKLINENPDINITVKARDLKEFGETIASQTANTVLENKEERLYTRKEVIKLFNVSAPTLWRWTQSNLIHSKKIGNRVYYPETEIKRLTNLKTSEI